MDIRFVAVGIVSLFIGYQIGYRIQTKEILEYCERAAHLKEVIKNRNNEMVTNFANLYSLSEHDPNEFTEIDALLASMWME